MAIGGDPTDLITVDLGARAPLLGGAKSAMFAPAAMLLGAFGLLALWSVAPRVTMDASPATAASLPAAAEARQAGAVEQAAASDEQALSHLLADLGAAPQLVSAPIAPLTATAAQTVEDLRRAEVGMISAADLDARSRLQTAREAFRDTGLDARAYMADGAHPAGLSPLELRDARVLGARLDMDPGLAGQVQQAARDLIAASTLKNAAAALPLATPVDDPVRSSPFGERVDPFTHKMAFHPGQDFSGHYGEAIHVTAPGVVSFVGQRSGYGNCVEVDHGHGFKTRYGHLSGFEVGVGQVVKMGDVIARMGSTGRSTGVHLHYEVWASGRLQDPARFLNADAVVTRG